MLIGGGGGVCSNRRGDHRYIEAKRSGSDHDRDRDSSSTILPFEGFEVTFSPSYVTRPLSMWTQRNAVACLFHLCYLVRQRDAL